MQPPPISAQTSAYLAPQSPRDIALKAQAKDFEASFMAEMLAHAGLGKSDTSFSGGIGEEQFSSFLRQEQARLLVEKGGIGLAEKLFTAMRGKADDR